jgi:hypothetical protein
MTAATTELRPNARLRLHLRWSRSAIMPWLAIVLYVLFEAAIVLRHEPWADEAHSWLLARDASLVQLWTKLLHYEGTPGLWQTVLHVLIRFGTPYAAFNFISMAAGTLAAWLMIARAPFPAVIRVLLPFTYYLFFQYAVVARSYSLLPALTFGCAALYMDARRRPLAFTLVACLLAAVSLDGFVLGAVIYGSSLLDNRREMDRNEPKQTSVLLACSGVFLLALFLLAWAAWPAADNQFVTHLNFSLKRLFTLTPAMFRYALTGEWVSMAAVIVLSLPFLQRGGMLFAFLAASLGLCLAHSLVYVDVWHIGAIFLAWLFCMWIAALRTPVTPFATWAFLLVIGFQGYWAVRTAYYDWNQAYSGSRDAALFLTDHPGITAQGVYLTGYSSEAIKPWFSLRDLQRFTHSNLPAWWDWSDRERGEDPAPLLTTGGFGYFLAGYKLPSEKERWADVAGLAGFRLLKHFEGNLFWRTTILEGESFDLYQRIGGPPLEELHSSLELADPSAGRQLLSGLHNPEANAWRWTDKTFSLALLRPPGAEASGARLTLRLFIPDSQIRHLGPMTLRAFVNGRPLDSVQTYSTPGDVTFVAEVPAADLSSALPVFRFTFDKVRMPSGNEDRQLSAIAKSISIETK